MPETNYGSNLSPKNEKEHAAILGWTQQAFDAAQGARRELEDKWQRWYKLYRSHVPQDAADWRSRLFIPEVFTTIETILPRLVAQLPRFTVNPVGPEDVEPAKVMEFLLNHSAEQSGLYVELVECYKDALMYGTGIMKVRMSGDDEFVGTKYEERPVYQDLMEEVPVIDPDTGQPLLDLEGNPVTEQRSMGQIQTGTERVPVKYFTYEGPICESIDIFNFWVAPESDDIDSARYVIHRVYKELGEVKRLIKEGIYNWPGAEQNFEALANDSESDPHLERLRAIEMGGAGYDSTRKQCEVLEFWTDDNRVITVVNRRAVVRVQENPFTHGQKPFIRFVDHIMPHEFYGVGEIEVLEGPQDLINKIQNQRTDEVTLKLNKPFIGNPDLLVDLRDLAMRPGAFIRTKSDARPDEILSEVQFGDVNSSAYMEVDALQRIVERATGVSSLQQGLPSDAENQTATGASILQEMGSSRFGFKTRVIELLALSRLAKQMGSIIQQFTTQEKVVRQLGPNGLMAFQAFDPASLQGAFDYTIETASIIQSETVKRQQANELFNLLMPIAAQGMPITPAAQKLIEGLLDSYGIKDKHAYLAGLAMIQPGMSPVGQEIPQQTMPEMGL